PRAHPGSCRGRGLALAAWPRGSPPETGARPRGSGLVAPKPLRKTISHQSLRPEHHADPESTIWMVRRYDRRVHYGAHLGVAGGAHKAPERAHALKATSLQIFTQSPRMWRLPDLDFDAAERLRAARTGSRVAIVGCHA